MLVCVVWGGEVCGVVWGCDVEWDNAIEPKKLARCNLDSGAGSQRLLLLA